MIMQLRHSILETQYICLHIVFDENPNGFLDIFRVGGLNILQDLHLLLLWKAIEVY